MGAFVNVLSSSLQGDFNWKRLLDQRGSERFRVGAIITTTIESYLAGAVE